MRCATQFVVSGWVKVPTSKGLTNQIALLSVAFVAEEKLRFLMSLQSKGKKLDLRVFSEQYRRSVHKELCRPEGRTHFLKFRYSLENHKCTDGDSVR